jgi:hypothetical protein
MSLLELEVLRPGGPAEPMELRGDTNTTDEVMRAQIAHAIRQGLPQVWPQPTRGERIALVGSGPSLAETVDELRELVWSGAKLVTLNGAYQWCLERNLKPSAQIVMDARPSTARFVTPAVPGCRYYVASQCHADVFTALEGREHVGLWHAVVRDGKDDADPTVRVLEDYFRGHWTQIPGGTTVATRALFLLRTLGYLRFDLFGVDSCWLDDAHHALPQPENAADQRHRWTLAPVDRPDLAKDFWMAPWHVQQIHDVIQILTHHGSQFQFRVHGRGALAHLLDIAAEGEITCSAQEE